MFGFLAPEILSYEPISLATDIWSVGVLTYVLLSGYSPFGADNKQETFLNISQCELTFPSSIFPDVSTVAVDFIRSTLVLDPRQVFTSKTSRAQTPNIRGSTDCAQGKQKFEKKTSRASENNHAEFRTKSIINLRIKPKD